MALISGLEHVGIVARDSAKLKDWYLVNLDCREVFNDGKTPPMVFIAMQDDSIFEIYPYDTDSPAEDNKVRGLRHLAISCPMESFDDAVARFQALGVEPVSGPSKGTAACNFFFRDPEGNIIQLVARAKSLV